jgi:hypothetical protein
MVQVATDVKFGDFHSRACEPISKTNEVNPLKGTMAYAATRPRYDVAVNDCSFNMDKTPEVTSRRDKQWGISAKDYSPELAESVSKFHNMEKSTAASSASLAGQARSSGMLLS